MAAYARGRVMLPWAAAAADVLGEQNPDGTMRYPVAVVLVPRQCGKTTLAFDLAAGRCMTQTDYRVAYCAQTGHATTERFGELYDSLGALAPLTRTRRSQGTERLTFARTRSYIKAFPPIDGSLRGSALDLVVCDEAQAHNEDLGAALDRTIMPTFNTRRRSQLLLLGTAGNAMSAWLRRYYDKARDGEPGFALVDYGAEEGTPVDDETAWPRFHPGLAGGLTTAASLRTALSVMGADDFRREYLNLWDLGADDSYPVPFSMFAALADPQAQHAPGRAWLGFDVTPDRTAAALAGASRHGDGRVFVEVLWQGETAGLLQAVRAATARRRAAVLAPPAQADRCAALRADRVPAQALTGVDYTAACQRLADLTHSGHVTHRGQPALLGALRLAQPSWRGDAWAWSARGSRTDITPLVAATVAAAAAATRAAPSVQ